MTRDDYIADIAFMSPWLAIWAMDFLQSRTLVQLERIWKFQLRLRGMTPLDLCL